MNELHFNEMPFSLHRKVIEDFCHLVSKADLNKYGNMRGEMLLGSLSKYLNISEKNIAVGNGSDELLKVAAETFLKGNKKLMTVEPSFVEYANYSRMAGGEYIAFHLGDDLEFQEEKFLRMAEEEEPDMIYLSTPENPSGRVYSREFLMKILERTGRSILVVDEAYIELSSAESLYKEAAVNPRLLCSRTFSKAYGAAGVRLGYIMGTEENIEAINDMRLIFSLSQMGELMGVALLDNIHLCKERVDYIKGERERVYGEVKDLDKIKIYPSQGNFFLIKSALDLEKIFLREKILINKVKWNEGFYRISLGDAEANNRVIEILKEL